MNMDYVQYFHGTKEKYGTDKQFTVCLVVPTRENLRIDIWKLLGTNIKEIDFLVGVAKVSPKDQYNKKTGRDVSYNKLGGMSFRLVEVVALDDGIVVELTSGSLSILLKMMPDSDKVRLINAYI
jgi:hypothetical protein